MKDKIGFLFSAVCFGLLLGISGISVRAEASGGEEYITISVDATDDNAGLMYALDTDNPDAFTSNNEFRVLAGTSHTIYVKDSAGNITSQSYDVEGVEEAKNITQVGSGSSGSEKGKYYEYLTDSPAEAGEGTIYDKTVTNGSDSAEKVFYTIKTAEDDVFYLVLDQGQSANNVYLLNQVTNSELSSLAVDDTGIQQKKENEQNLLSQLKETPTETITEEETNEKTLPTELLKKLAIFGAIGAGLYYYFKVYKKKKNVELDFADAKDLDDFEAEEEDEVFFDDEYTEEEKERYLQELIENDDDFYEQEMTSEESENEEDLTDDSEASEDISDDGETGFLEENLEYDPELDGEEEE